MATKATGSMRQFESGATRDTNAEKLEYRRFLSMPALRRYAEYMNKHRQTAAGLREPDNWKKGIPLSVYADSLYRHTQELALAIEQFGYRGSAQTETEETACAILFNAFGYLHELLKGAEA